MVFGQFPASRVMQFKNEVIPKTQKTRQNTHTTTKNKQPNMLTLLANQL